MAGLPRFHSRVAATVKTIAKMASRGMTKKANNEEVKTPTTAGNITSNAPKRIASQRLTSSVPKIFGFGSGASGTVVVAWQSPEVP